MTAATARKKIFVTRLLPPDVESRMAEHYDVVHNPSYTSLSDTDLASMATGFDYLLVSGSDQVSRRVFEALAGTLKVVLTLSVGFNHIDIEAAKAFGIPVLYTPGVLSDACADLALMLLLSAARRAHEADMVARSGNWPGFAPTQLMGIGLAGRRAGILGMGGIGQAVAHRLRAFGVAVHYHNRRRLPAEQELDATYHETAESLLAASDFFLICAPATTGLGGFLNRERIALLPKGAIVVNVGRGDLVSDDALIEALQSGHLFAAGLDVYPNEPHIDPRYYPLPNAILMPHIGSATTDARNAMGFLLLDGLATLEAGGKPENQLC
ncbi:D-glycerate dehydrogenase [Granulicella sp. WH15]|uniref:2-hydroxyacid dehydrogenase n=1 Tax=Granulicella sp. WH15 TaxID=2602070 RepID=UPI002103FF26|nr:D-glycerate dehydrogenase [Granulicella sp. WH15]